MCVCVYLYVWCVVREKKSIFRTLYCGTRSKKVPRPNVNVFNNGVCISFLSWLKMKNEEYFLFFLPVF